MAGMVLPIISSAVRSPWFKATRDLTTAYSDHEGRLTPVTAERPIVDEYRVLRTKAGIFDVPEVPLEIRGPDAAAFLDYVFTRPVSTMAIDRGRYGLMCHDGGGITCDGVVFRLAEDWFWYVHADRDVFTWLQALSLGYDVEIRDPGAWAIQIQGPTSLEILDACVDGGAPEGFKYYHARQVTMGGQPVLISRTGWTAELGFEVYNIDPHVDGMALWSHLMAAGAPHGMEFLSTYAMNPRRIEAGIMNYGTDMGWDTTPFDLGLGGFVDFDHDFVGRGALQDAERKPRFSGFVTEAKDVKWGAPVFASGKTVGRVKAFEPSPTLADPLEPPDAALIAVSRVRTIEVVAELSAMGAGGAVSIVGEFSEAGEDGAALQARLIEAAGDLALVGPNCMGVINMFDRAAVWGGNNVFEPVSGDGIALISQSGYVAYSITNVEEALPLGYAISMGNQTVLNVADFIEALLDDPRVRAIGLYLEGIVDVAALSRSALRAIDKGIPVVALKAGGTEESSELTRSHSGTLAVANELWSALFRRLGIVEAASPKALIETLKLLGSGKPLTGNRVVAAANSGGYAAMIGEKGRAVGLEFPAPDDAAQQALHHDVPDLVSLLNPLDWNLPWASMARSETSDVGLGHLMADEADLLFYFIDWPRQKDVANVWWPTLEGLIRLNARITQPVVIASVLPDGLPPDLRRQLTKAGLICLQGLDDALVAMAAAGKYHTFRRAVLADRENRELYAPPPEPKCIIQLDEAEGKAALASCGLTIPKGVTGSAGHVIAQADTLGYPLAVKLLSADLAHKNHAGAVHLNVGSKPALEEAIEAIKASVRAYDPTLSTDRFLIERMVASPRAEFIVGVSYKPGLGHALVIGRGGTAVEELKDYATLLLPAGWAQIEDALASLRISGKLKLSDAERTVLVTQIQAIAAFAKAHRSSLVELDVNPIILDTEGRATAVDALLRLARG